MSSRRRGTPPKSSPTKLDLTVPKDDGYLLLSFRHLMRNYGVDEMSEAQRSEFLVKWVKRSQFTWKELLAHDKHGLGFEMLPRKQLMCQAPEHLEADSYMVFRHQGNLPFVGFKAGDTFYVMWIATSYDHLYRH